MEEYDLSYDEQIMCWRVQGERMDLDYREYNREKVLKQLQEFLVEVEEEQPFMRESLSRKELLWLLPQKEVVEKGIYRWNRPDVDLAIAAPPTLMAIVMGEYELAQRLSKSDATPKWLNRVKECYLNGTRAYLGGGTYNFFEACMLSDDMTAQEMHVLLPKNKWPKVSEYGSFLEDFQFHRGEGAFAEDIWHPIISLHALIQESEEKKGLIQLLTRFVIKIGVDNVCGDFWERLYGMFTGECREQIVQAVHKYALYFSDSTNKLFYYEDRLLHSVEVFFRYEKELSVSREVAGFIEQRLPEDLNEQSRAVKFMMRYMNAVKQFGGTVTDTWWTSMTRIMESCSLGWIRRCLDNGFLKEECIPVYVEYLFQIKSGTGIIPLLIQQSWRSREEK